MTKELADLFEDANLTDSQKNFVRLLCAQTVHHLLTEQDQQFLEQLPGIMANPDVLIHDPSDVCCDIVYYAAVEEDNHYDVCYAVAGITDEELLTRHVWSSELQNISDKLYDFFGTLLPKIWDLSTKELIKIYPKICLEARQLFLGYQPEKTKQFYEIKFHY